MAQVQRVAMLTKEYPPYVYGGAGVHVEYLCRELARLIAVEVRCFGDQDVQDGRLTVKGYGTWDEMARNTDPRFVGALDACARDLAMAKDWLDADVVHCHTWYTSLAGRIAAELWGVPCVVTIHSLEPLRPVEGRAVGQRLLPERLDGTDGDRAGRCRDRRLRGYAPGRACACSTSRPRGST